MPLQESIQKFYNSILYVLFAMGMILAGHFTGKELIFGSALVFSFFLGCCVCTDFRFALYPFMGFICICAREHAPSNPLFSNYFLESPVLDVVMVNAVFVLTGLAVFAVRNFGRANKPYWRSGVLPSLLLFCAAMFLNGLGNQNYTKKNLLLAGIYFVFFVVIFVYFSAFIQYDKRVFDYFMICLLFFGLTVCAEIVGWFFFDMEMIDGHVNKDTVFLGWGFWTTIGGLLAMCLPAGFYFARDHKFGWIGYFASVLIAGCTVLAQSRGGMLWGGVVGVISVIILCVSGKNRKINRILTLCFLGAAILAAILFREKVVLLLRNFLEKGFDDNGRYPLWRAAWKNFKSSPVFGVGFYESSIDYGWTYRFFPNMCHNTILELLSAGGIILAGAYLLHRLTTVILVFRRPNSFKTFTGLCALGLLLFSMTDLLLFVFYPTFIYSFMLLMMERSDEYPFYLPNFSRK